MRTMKQFTMESSEQFPVKLNIFQPEIVKKETVEPLGEDVVDNKHDNNFNAVKQEYYSKLEPELNLDWDEKYNIYGTNPENTGVSCDAVLSKLYNPIVLLKRLPDSILTKFSKPKDIDLKSENLCHGTEANQVLVEPKGEDATSTAVNFSRCSRCKKQLKSQLSLRHHLLYCGKLPHLQCNHCAYKTKYKSALKSHTLLKHSTKKITGKNLILSTGTLKRSNTQRNVKVMKSDASGHNRKIVIKSKNKSFKTKSKCNLNKHKMSVCSGKQVHSKNKKASRYLKKRLIYHGKNGMQCKQCSFTTNHNISLQKHMKKVHFNNLQACSKCCKKFKYTKSLEKHVAHCEGSLDLQTNLCSLKFEKRHVSKKQFEGKAVTTCSTCNKKFKYKKSFERHINYCKKSLYHQANQRLSNTTGKDLSNKHTTSKKFEICPKCAKKFKTRQSLKGHLAYCGKEPNLQCKHCSFKTKYPANLAYHISHTHKENQKEHPDRYKQLKKQSRLKVHPHHCGQSPRLQACPKCGKWFTNQQSLKRHLHYCGKERNLQCDQCSYKTSRKGDLAKHLKFIHLERDMNYFLACFKCGNRYKNQQSLTRHSYLCGQPPRFQCDYCPYKTNMKTSLKRHIVRLHLEKDVNYFLQCLKCGKRYKNQLSLAQHTQICGKEPHLECDYCSYKAHKKGNLRRHIQTHLDKDANKFLPCSKCGKRYNHQSSWAQHTQICGKEPHLQCDYCSYKAHEKGSLRRHILHVHLEKDVNHFLPCSTCNKRYKNQQSLTRHSYFCRQEARFQCDYCSYKTYIKESLKNHIIAVHVEKDVNYFLPCPKCGKRYKNQRSLTRHSYFCRQKARFRCDYCSYKTNIKQSLKRHIIAIHMEKDVNYFLPCPKCDKRYKNQRSLTRHSYDCGQEARFKCDYCSYKTHVKRDLANHILLVHFEKNVNHSLPCSKCGKIYKNQQSLTQHLSLCGKEPHLHCDYCPYRTSLKSRLKTHILQAHLEKDVNNFLPCSKCGRRYKNQQSLTRHSYLCGQPPRLQCDYCSYKTKMKASLRCHILRLHLEKDVNYSLSCSKCEKRYKNQPSLTRHLDFCGKEPQLQCDNCSHRALRKSDLAKHILAVHLEKDMNYISSCLKCGKKYKNRKSLTRHSVICRKKSQHSNTMRTRSTGKKSLTKRVLPVYRDKKGNFQGFTKYKDNHEKKKTL